jgi:hypothetical protein
MNDDSSDITGETVTLRMKSFMDFNFADMIHDSYSSDECKVANNL